ncbi:phage tail tape measure protein, partial [Escherichia coli]
GGQVKDSFGGMIPMFRGLAGAITLPMVGVTSLALAPALVPLPFFIRLIKCLLRTGEHIR